MGEDEEGGRERREQMAADFSEPLRLYKALAVRRPALFLRRNLSFAAAPRKPASAGLGTYAVRFSPCSSTVSGCSVFAVLVTRLAQPSQELGKGAVPQLRFRALDAHAITGISGHGSFELRAHPQANAVLLLLSDIYGSLGSLLGFARAGPGKKVRCERSDAAAGVGGARLFGILPLGTVIVAALIPLPPPRKPGTRAELTGSSAQLRFGRATLAAAADGTYMLNPGDPATVYVTTTLLSATVSHGRPPAPGPRPGPSGPEEKGDVLYCFKVARGEERACMVTERRAGFTCFVCNLRCGSFCGLQLHLNSSHDAFEYDCIAPPDDSSATFAVNVTLKTELRDWNWRRAGPPGPGQLDAMQKEFLFSRPINMRDARRVERSRRGDVASGMADVDNDGDGDRAWERESETEARSVLSSKQRRDQQQGSEAGGTSMHRSQPAEQRFSAAAAQRKRKRKGTSRAPNAPPEHPLAGRGMFFHARTYQPFMPGELEDPGTDSDDQEDVDTWKREQRSALQEFEDVSQAEKEFMFMWNSFARRQCIYSDAYLPHACAAFARAHARRMREAPVLRRVFALFLSHLWHFHLVPPASVDACLRVVDDAAGPPAAASPP